MGAGRVDRVRMAASRPESFLATMVSIRQDGSSVLVPGIPSAGTLPYRRPRSVVMVPSEWTLQISHAAGEVHQVITVFWAGERP